MRFLALPGIVWVEMVPSYAPIEEDRSHARRGVVPGAAGVDRSVDGGGRRGGHAGATSGGPGGTWAGAVPMSRVRDGGAAVRQQAAPLAAPGHNAVHDVDRGRRAAHGVREARGQTASRAVGGA